MRSTFDFDVNQFMESSVNPQGFVFDTKVEFVPEGEYEATLISLNPGKYTIRRGPDEGQERTSIRPLWEINDPSLKEKLNIERPMAEQFITLDCDPPGSLNLVMTKNRNVDLSRLLLTPLGFNKGKPWTWGQLLYNQAWIRVVLPNDEEISRYSRIAAVGARQSDVARKSR